MDEINMDAVLPLRARDVDRAKILLRSLRRRFTGLGRLWIVSPDRELAEIRSALQAFASPNAPWELAHVAETELIPELSAPARMAGWYRQQLIKLAIAERITTRNYLTFDADVICTRAVSPRELAPDGRGLCHIIPEDLHPRWYVGSSRVLGLEPVRQGILHNVTPAVLHREAVLRLQRHLAQRAAAKQYRADWAGLRQRVQLRLIPRSQRASWRSYLITGVPWTEYALYYTYLEATGQLERYHQLSDRCIYALEHSVWYGDRRGFEHWHAAPLFSGRGAPYFAVVQSNTGLAPSLVWAKVGPYIEPV